MYTLKLALLTLPIGAFVGGALCLCNYWAWICLGCAKPGSLGWQQMCDTLNGQRELAQTGLSEEIRRNSADLKVLCASPH